MKKVYSISIILLVTLSTICGLYFIQYPIKIDKLSLEAELREFEKLESIRVQKIKVVDDKVIAFYTYDNGMGFGVYNKGLNNRCVLVSSNRDSGGFSFPEGNVSTNRGNYNIFAGENFDNKINIIQLISDDGRKLMMDVSKGKYFLFLINNPRGTFTFYKLDLLDENGKSIRDEIIQKYLKNYPTGHVKAKMELKMFNYWYLLVIASSIILIYSKYNVNPKKKSTEGF